MSARNQRNAGLVCALEPYRGSTGIYALRDNQGIVLYVGKADCLFSRVSHHLKRRDDVDSVEVFVYDKLIHNTGYIEAGKILRWLEKYWIDKLEPIENCLRGGHSLAEFYALPEKVKAILVAGLPPLCSTPSSPTST